MQKIRFIILVTIFLISSLSYSQQGGNEWTPCYFDQLMKIKKNDPSQYKKIIEAEAKIEDGVQNLLSGNKKVSSDIKTIPIVVHIIHNGGSENISEAQIQSQIDVLNEDFGKFPGTNGDGNGVDTRARFCLAKISPDGNCTNGIVRIKSTLTDHQSYERALLKELSFWDNTRYLNIYVMKSISGALGYSSYPGGPPDADGIVVRHNVFGRTGTASSSLGRTTTHELGHWFGLYHTFQGGCGTDTCTTGDLICDTPPAADPNYGCPTGVNSCSNDNPDLPDQIENYMDYSDDACSNMLTNGQKLRIQATLNTIRTAIWTDSNLVATGCDTNYIAPPSCPIVADFITLTPEICVGNSIYFMDISLNDATNWLWLFPGGTPDSSTLQNPTITYDATGTYSVTLIASDSLSSDSLILTDYISVTNPGIGNPLPFLEDFESGIFPSQGITINNADGGITWELDSLASTSGKYSIRINNLINTNYGSADEIILPFFDMTTDTNGVLVFLKFKWAYARSDPNFSDELIVLASRDCGQSFNSILYKSGNSLATGPTQTTPFIPDSSQWDSVSVFLGNYKDDPYVLLKIVNVTDGGNNLYIDDISLGDLSLLPPPPTYVDDVQRD
ncbi:choice-of-anchor J domain-containing protein, partial [bacterium AH-315-M05]|nr:choice-of-anchor J domain-containing protein [bacterium AH-315-M05]